MRKGEGKGGRGKERGREGGRGERKGEGRREGVKKREKGGRTLLCKINISQASNVKMCNNVIVNRIEREPSSRLKCPQSIVATHKCPHTIISDYWTSRL